MIRYFTLVVSADSPQEPSLAVEGILSLRRHPAKVRAVALHYVSLGRVGQVDIENVVFHALDQRWVFQREQDFHAGVEIAGHEIGASDVNLFPSSIPEIVGAAVLQETAHHTQHLDLFADSGNSGPEAADSAH